MSNQMRPLVVAGLDQHAVAQCHVAHDVVDLALDARGRDPVRFVIRQLLLAPPVGLAHRALHASRHAIGVQDHPPVDIARGAADGLDQRRLRSQEPFLVGIENRDQPAFGDVEPLAQQIDPDQHVIHPEPQVADQLDPLERFDIAMHVAHAKPRLVEIFGQILGHPLGQRRHQGAIALRRDLFRFVDQIVDLVLDRLDLDRRVDQPGRTDDLLGEHPAGRLHLPRPRGRRDERRLRPHRVPLVEPQRPVVDAARQAEAIFRQRDLAPVIALRHRPDLRHRLMALINEQQRIVGQIFEQGRRRLARQSAGQEARVILDPRAAARRGDHLEIEIGALLEPLQLEQLALRLQLLQPLGEFMLDRLARLLERRPGRHIMRIGEHADGFERRCLAPGQRIEFDNLLDLVAEEGNAPRAILIMRRENLQIVALDAEIAAREPGVVALVLQRDELADDLALVGAVALLQVEDHRRIGFDRADAVEARHRGDDDHVVTFEKGAGSAMPHPVDPLVHRAFLLDVGVGPRDIGLGLVIIVVTDEKLDRIVGEIIAEFAIELRGEDLVRCEDQGGPLRGLDDLGHGEGLAAAGDAEQHLVDLATF